MAANIPVCMLKTSSSVSRGSRRRGQRPNHGVKAAGAASVADESDEEAALEAEVVCRATIQDGEEDGCEIGCKVSSTLIPHKL